MAPVVRNGGQNDYYTASIFQVGLDALRNAALE